MKREREGGGRKRGPCKRYEKRKQTGIDIQQDRERKKAKHSPYKR